MNENPPSSTVWEGKLTWFKSSPQYRILDTIDGEPMEFEWNIFPRFTTLQLVDKVQEFKYKTGYPAQFKGRIIFMSMFNDIIWWTTDNEKECIANATLVSLFAKRFPAGCWSFFGPASEKKWYSTYIDRPRGECDRVAVLMMMEFSESGHPVFRAASPLSRGTLKSKGGGKLSIHFCSDGDTIETVFRTVVSVNQSVSTEHSHLCEEYSACQTRTVRPVLAGQSDPFFEPAKLLITTPTPSIEIPAQENSLLKYKERVERLSQQDRVISMCTDAGFLTTVDVGQHFMTKDIEEFLQFTESVACPEYTLPRDEKSSDPKGWIRGNTKIGPVLEVTTIHLQGKYGVEIRIESVNMDNSQSWVRISHGLNKLVTDLIDKEYDDNEQETSETKTEAFALKADVFAFASRSKAKAKPRRPTSACSSTRTVPLLERTWTDIEPGAKSNQAHPVAKRLNTLLRRIISRRRWSDRILETERWSLEQIWALSILVWWCMEDYNGRRWRQQEKISILYWLAKTRNSFYLRALQSHSGGNPIDPTLQDNMLIPDNLFEYIHHVGCAISLHSTTNSGLIAGGQNSSKERQTVFFTAVNPMDEDHKDPYNLHLTKPRLASYKQKKWKRHQDTVCKVHFQLSQRNWFKFYQARCNAIILLRYTPSLLYLEGCCDGIWRYHMPESVCVTSTTADDFLLR